MPSTKTMSCSVPGCTEKLSVHQIETTEKLYGKPYCIEHEKLANEEATKASEQFTVDTKPYIDCGFKIENGLAVKVIGQAEVVVDFTKVKQGVAKKFCIQVGGYDYEYDLNQEVDAEIKKLFLAIEKRGAVSGSKKDKKEQPATPAPARSEEYIKEPEANKMDKVEKTEPKDNLPAPITTNAIVRPAVSPQEAIAAWKEFNELKQAIITGEDRQKIGDRTFVKKSGWRKLAAFFNLTDKITEEAQMPHPDGGWTWKIKVECIAPNGRTSEGVGICSTSERKFAHVEHDTYSTAHTRAKNRAISDMIAGGEVSAEEME